MKRYVISFIFLAGAAGAVLSQGASVGDAERLQGEWSLTSVEIHGKTLPASGGKGGSIVFAKDGKVILKDPGKLDKSGTYKIDSGKSPKQLDLILVKGGNDGEERRGIYELNDDELKIGFSKYGPKGNRPDGFKGDKIVILNLKRQKT
jgi:uncharacterized protein (TIGR03067 family)